MTPQITVNFFVINLHLVFNHCYWNKMNVPVPDEYQGFHAVSSVITIMFDSTPYLVILSGFYLHFYLMFLLDWIATFISLYPNLLLLENKDKGIKDLATQKCLSVVTLSNYSII